MSEKPLLLSSAKVGVLVSHNQSGKWWRAAAAATGLFVVLVGAADVASRLAHATLGSNATFMAFAPAITVLSPSLRDSFFNQGVSPSLSSSTSATSTRAIVPAELVIPSIGVSAAVEQVGKKDDGSMGTPQKFDDVAWYALGAKPGEAGNAVIAGHVNNALTTSGVFEHLSQITLGDTITLSDSSGHTLTYAVTQIQEYPADQAPAASIFATEGPSQVVLITCDGDWVQTAHSFDKRLVVFATLK